MRRDFIQQLIVEMEKHSELFFLAGDLGFRALEPLKERFPRRFLNMGIAEANMMGVAAGLAMSGKRVFVYSIVPFATMRCYEQIRNDVCFQNLNVKIVGVGGGLTYGSAGITHHAIEDIAIMRALPNMKVICPAYSWEVKEATKAIVEERGPIYLRLGRSPSQDFFRSHFSFALGKGFEIKRGREIILICTGDVLGLTLKIAESVGKQLSKNVGVISMPSVKPLDIDLILKKAMTAVAVFTIEEHNVIGGLGSAVSETLVQSNLPKRIFHAFGITDKFVIDVGSQEYLRAAAGLSIGQISNAIYSKIKKAHV